MALETVSRLGEDVSSVDRATVASLAGVALAGISTVLMLQSMRVFVSYLVFVVDQSNRSTLAAIATGVFVLSGLSWLLIRLVGPRSVVIGSAGLLALSRLALQFWENPTARLWLGGAALICWGWLLFALLISRHDLVALGTGLGLALDLGIRIAFQTVDTPWMPGFTAHLMTIVLVGALLASLRLLDLPEEVQPASLIGAVSLLSIGPAFALYHLVTGNLGLAQARLGVDFPGAAVVLAFGMALGILVSALRCSGEIALVASGRWWYLWRFGLIVLMVAGLRWFWIGAMLSSVGLILGVATSVILFTELLIGRTAGQTGVPAGWSALFFTLGLLLEVGLLFAYYTFSGSPGILVAVVALFAATCLSGAPASVSTRRDHGVSLVIVAGALGGLLLLISAWEVWSWDDVGPDAAIGPNVTVMTYNIQSGFAVDDRFALDETARAIEAQQPDIVVLQEVSRGWLVTSGIDEALWLSQRLHMNYAFGANSDDGLWGNVVLSRAPLGAMRTIQYDVTENLKRSAIEVQVETQVGDLWVLGTHLDDPRDAGAVRLKQAEELVASWNQRSPALVMGDMNSDPNDPVIFTLRSAGFVDFGEALDSPAYTSHDQRRIDYIFGTRDMLLRDILIPNVWTSDHRPVVATLTLLPIEARQHR
ncbi:MAG TPA: endonuclease/exonuclease/phosphatase family protein [Nitrolancea sp.]